MSTQARFTQEGLDLYKAQYPNDPSIQALTLAQVNQETAGTVVDFNGVPPLATYESKRGVITDCAIAVGVVVFDTVCLALGVGALGKSVSGAAARATAEALTGPVMSAVEKIIARMSAIDATAWDKAVGFFNILSAIYNGGCFGAVLDAFLGALSVWEAIAYGIVGVGTIVAILATDGIALIAEIVVLLTSLFFLGEDIAKAVRSCSLIGQPIADPAKPPVFAFANGAWGALKTFSGNLVTVARGGGLFYGTNPIITNRQAVGAWEKFIAVSVDQKAGSFALRTASGHYLTACNGGGVSGPDDASCPIRTNQTKRGEWERLALIAQPDGTYAIKTPQGFYLSANEGGGMNPHSGSQVMHTAQTQIGQWELFKFAA